MTTHSQQRKAACLEHRQQAYEDGLDRLIAGKESPEYVKYRFRKLKRIKRGGK